MAASPPQGQPLTALGMAGASAAVALPIVNPDLFWHLSAGRWIAAHRAVPRADWLSWTASGKPWVDFEWAAQLVYWGVHSAFGMAGLWALKAAVLAGAAAAMAGVLALHGIGREGRAVAAFAWALAIAPGNDLRPENFSLLLLLVLLLLLEWRRLGGSRRLPAWAVPAAVAGLFAAWANAHAGFTVGLALLGAYSLSEPRRLWELPFAAAAACANPYGFEVYRLTAGHAQSMAALRGNIQEWGSPGLGDPWMIPALSVMAAGVCAGAARLFGGKAVGVPWLGPLAALLAAAGLMHARMIPYFACVGVPYAALAARGLEPRLVRRALWAATLGLWAFAGWKLAPVLSRRVAARFDAMPRLAADFLGREAPALGHLRMLNPWSWGGYLGWRLYPGYRVYWDGRYLFHSMIGPEAAARAHPDAYGKFLDEQGISLVVLARTRQTVRPGGANSPERPLYAFFLPSARWALVHWDSLALVFVRRSEAPGEWLKSRELALVRPDDGPAAALSLRASPTARARALEEARRLPSVDEDRDAAAEVGRLLAGARS